MATSNGYTVFIFAGTGDGKKLVVSLLSQAEKKRIKIKAHIFCATDYGGELMKNEIGEENISIHTGRLDENEMLKVMLAYKPDYVIDCTHPYAELVTRNIKTVCKITNTKYLRLRREISVNPPVALKLFYAGCMEEAAAFLAKRRGNILLTTGSKSLNFFTGESFAGRVYPRVLPIDESLRACREAGIAAKNVIAMQGPFSETLNRAMIRQINAEWLVSKESGVTGALGEKMNAAFAENCGMLLIKAPSEDGGLDAETVINRIIGAADGITGLDTDDTIEVIKTAETGGKKQYFPVFQNISNKRFLFFGAGTVAERRIKTLLRFNVFIEVVAPEISDGIKSLCDERFVFRRDAYKADSCNADFIIAATNDRDVNRMIGEECRGKNIPVSVADSKEESTFYFPAIVSEGGLTIGITSDGLDHNAVRRGAKRIREMLRPIMPLE
jgi:precorrin-2 dehydrogenase/sirohydrochlorin ferrochelatase/precorrin-6A/cobalt-precorrin-6A reductase